MVRDKQPTFIVYVLAAGAGTRPHKIRCENIYCRRVMMTINRDIEHVIKNSKGIHWADTPDEVTVVEHKCRGCEHVYRIYTQENQVAYDKTMDSLNEAGSV